MDVAVGEMGLSRSRRFGGDFGTMVVLEDCMDSNALMRALTAEEAIAAAEKEGMRTSGRAGTQQQESRARAERLPRMVLTPNPHARERLGKGRGGFEASSPTARRANRPTGALLHGGALLRARSALTLLLLGL